ncbi:MAG TPA: hypothetical protein PLY87_21920 [Planctomycetaceae bacterium]|nr:hypothetical protein [Planctomycetaceae bacterium]
MSNEFDVPDGLRAFLTLDDAESNLSIVTVIVDPEKKGELISIAALAEEEISKLIVVALAHPDRRGAFEELIANQLTFHQKVEVFKRLIPDFEPQADKYQGHLQFLAALKKLRNTAAHSYGMSPDDALKLKRDSEIVQLAADFPKSAWTRMEKLRDFLQPHVPTE